MVTISMCNEMVMSEIKEIIISCSFCPNYYDLGKTQVKLFPNFMRKPFDYLLISWMTNNAHIVYQIDH